MRRNILNEIGLYDTQFKCSADYDYYFRIVKSMYFLDLENGEGASLEKVEPCFVNKWIIILYFEMMIF